MSYDDWKATNPADYEIDSEDTTEEYRPAIWRDRIEQEATNSNEM